MPGIGWALGVDRTLLALRAEGAPEAEPEPPAVFAVPLGAAAKRRTAILAAELRRAGMSADMAYGERGLKGAMKAADKSGARIALILGDRDLDAGVVQVKELDTGEQHAVPLNRIVDELAGVLAGAPGGPEIPF
jgi:histidyl-tRNA synthetase